MATVSNAIVQAHFLQARRRGYGDEDLLRQCGLIPDEVLSGAGRSNAKAFASWLSQMWLQNDDEAGGFLERPVKSGTFAMSMHAVISAGNLRRALIRSGKFYQLVNDQIDVRLTEQGEEAHLTFALGNPDDEHQHVFYDALMVLWLRWSSWIIDRPLLLERIHLPFALPPYAGEYAYMYQCPVYTHQKDFHAVFSRKYLDLPIIQPPQALPEFLSGAPGNLLMQFRQEDNLSSQILQAFASESDLHAVDQNAVAERLHMSAVTLRRQLKKEGQSFQQLKDQYRRKQAFELLRHSDKPLQEISEILGYSELSAFSRAFKKWTGRNPGDVRVISEKP